MSDFLLAAPNYGQTDWLDTTRNKAVNATLAVVAYQHPEIAYIGGNPSVNEQCSAWQHYGHAYMEAGRADLRASITNENVLDGTKGDIASYVGELALGFVDAERAQRRDIYRGVLIGSIVDCIELNDDERSLLRQNAGNSLDQVQKNFRNDPIVVSHIVADSLQAHILRRMPIEKDKLLAASAALYDAAA